LQLTQQYLNPNTFYVKNVAVM